MSKKVTATADAGALAAFIAAQSPEVLRAAVQIMQAGAVADRRTVSAAAAPIVAPVTISRTPTVFPYAVEILTRPAQKVGSLYSTALVQDLDGGVLARSGISVRVPTGTALILSLARK